QDDKGWDARKRAYCLKIQPATGSFARNLIYSTKPTPCLILFNDNHLIHHKYIYVHIDISDTPPGVS
ncbi:hypothetical protein, partial [Klebsiella pneumoniae]|uniref:hypothetical protein n=1 Tax=Klebsiella pneumoniae TaxID=573 RepID=UPI003CF65ECE